MRLKKDVKEIVEICKKFDPAFISEVKCYKYYKDSEEKEHTYENYDIALSNCEEIKDLSIFIHFELIDDDSKLREILEFNSNRPIILCHCGLNDLDDNMKVFEMALALQHAYNNLWLEVSCVVWDYIGKDHRMMSRIDTDCILLGSDFTKFTTYDEIARTLDCLDYWSKKINVRRNITKLLRSVGKEQLNDYLYENIIRKHISKYKNRKTIF